MIDLVIIAARDDRPAHFVVAGFVVRDVRSRGDQYLSRFMGVSRFLVTVAFCYLLFAGVGCMSFCLAVLAIKLLLFLLRRPLSRQGRPTGIRITGSASSAPGAGVC